ncbi:curli assembly protein CsgF [Sulfitobacter sp. 1A13368]|jgi:hypothetical protein|uniref:curli assembly protein CsgF n=1 Tax=Sulfitobacter sp. 1A13368 TaxID=3368593 RepID=UPI003746ACE1
MFSAKRLLGLATAALLTSAGAATAGDLIYQPINPGFGGFSDNFGYLIGTAQIQNQYLPESEGSGGGGAPDISFPPIVIDLGGVGTPTPAVPAPQNASSTGSN